jgi:replication factor A1
MLVISDIVSRLRIGVRTYKNQKGEGRVGSIDLLDSSGDIRGTFFNDECDRWMSTLAVNTVYKIKGGQIKQANRQYNNCKSDCEITFGRDTVFEPLGDADAPKITYNFLKIEEIEQVEPGRPIDILAIVQVYLA